MKASEYRKQASKEITLPSGAKCTIRRFTQFDFLEVGEPPAALVEESAKASKKSKISREQMTYGLQVARVAMLRCCSPLRFEDGVLTIVEKPHNDCFDNEISVDALENADANEIITSVQAFSGLTKEVARKAKSFPEGQEQPGEPSPSGEVLRGSADGSNGAPS